MGLSRYRNDNIDDGYTNIDSISSNLRNDKPKWWFENEILPGDGPFNGINVDTTYDNTNKRIGVIDEHT